MDRASPPVAVHVTLDWPAARSTLLDARGAIDALCHRRESLEREILCLLPSAP
jgi:hypothetical protein